jgi:uncharacterized protein (DUF1697 family)
VTTWIALFRAINVGGNQILPMKDLVVLFERGGFESVRTYIQSGNVVFRSQKGPSTSLAKRIGDLVLKSRGFQPKVIVLSVAELEKAAAQNPFSKAEADPKTLHLFFLSKVPPAPDLKSMGQLKTDEEAFALKGKLFYLHAPHGVGTSKLAARAERCIGVDATARNWRTVSKLLEMALDSV